MNEPFNPVSENVGHLHGYVKQALNDIESIRYSLLSSYKSRVSLKAIEEMIEMIGEKGSEGLSSSYKQAIERLLELERDFDTLKASLDKANDRCLTIVEEWREAEEREERQKEWPACWAYDDYS